MRADYIQGRFEKIPLSEPFDFKRHKDNFPFYTEVLILPDGKVTYAVPSHSDALADIANVNLQDCPQEYWCSTLDWLMKLTGAVVMWYDYYRGEPNAKQFSVISAMKDYGIYGGSLLPTK